ncbi:hypothetical protein Mzhil_0132 [Methanosalsum zhilinae DSM 4017]|uniref:Cysteine--tRNA ligase n=1 Tax=Methanosalsum zhilinae (strain DSM 4017 / NBRC 107636 / OCM 62 / WeN5) TaxID=679901 RepID=F7XN55_METZD|nr:hypothetical protein Mzhil_0132 [Methanosalsum zhilinae DSM 4017]
MKVYNTLTGKKELFAPLEDKKVSIYACGPTVYSTPHIGNYRTFLMTDTIVRTLEYLGFDVKLVMNITDIDDKTIEGAKKAGMSLKEFTRIYTEEFFRGLDQLNIKRASAYPRATENIEGMINLAVKLVEKGAAYEKNGSVYFKISSFEEYGKLSKIDLDRIRIGASVDVDEYDKDNPRDFALLKASTREEVEQGIYYESPFGKVRPGWHTECVVMAMKEFGPTVDIHSGGEDLKFPHHENEIAQAESLTGKTFVRYWIHGKHLLVDGEKMSKSKGNVLSLSDLVETYGGEVVRYMFLSVHHKKLLNYTHSFADNARNNYQKLKETHDKLQFILQNKDGGKGTPDPEMISEMEKLDMDFREALEDDFNTQLALKSFHELSRIANIYMETKEDVPTLEAIFSQYTNFADVLGLFEKRDEEQIPEEVIQLTDKRETARKQRDWESADLLRQKVHELGYTIEDTKEGPRIKKIS